jgi:hypothetical protein
MNHEVHFENQYSFGTVLGTMVLTSRRRRGSESWLESVVGAPTQHLVGIPCVNCRVVAGRSPLSSMLCNYGYFFAAFVLDVGQLTQSFFSFTTSSRCLVSSDKSRMSTHQHSTTPLGLVKTSSADLTEHPGDPSLILTTNVDLGERKLDVMKACSKAIAEHTGKPESYVGESCRHTLYVVYRSLAP